MRHISRILTALLGVALFALPTPAFQNEPAGFRGVGWGRNVLEFRHLQRNPEQFKDGVLDFTNPREDLTLGSIRLRSVVYSFARNNIGDYVFYYGEMAFDRENRELVADALRSKYGPATSGEPALMDWMWEGETATIHLSCTDYDPECILRYYSTGVMEMRALEKERGYDNDVEKVKKGL